MRKNKVAFVISSLSAGGAERVVTNLANNLVEHYEVSIIILFKEKPFYKLDERIKIFYCLKSYELKKTRLLSIISQIEITTKIYRILKKQKTDITIGFMTTTNIYSIVASKLAKIPCIVSERTHPKFSSLSNFWSIARKKIYPLSSKVIVQTNDAKSYFLSFLNQEKLQVINNPLTNDLLEKRNPNSIKEQIILNVGRLSPNKNQILLIDAFKDLKLNGWQLYFIGDGKKRADYEDYVKAHNLNDCVKLIGSVKNMHDYYNTASIFAFTSNFEGFPNALTEAMAFGMCCISTDCPYGPSELIKNNSNGYLIPVGDKEMLKERLIQLTSNSEIREKIGLEAMKSVDEFLPKTVALQWSNLINNILND